MWIKQNSVRKVSQCLGWRKSADVISASSYWWHCRTSRDWVVKWTAFLTWLMMKPRMTTGTIAPLLKSEHLMSLSGILCKALYKPSSATQNYAHDLLKYIHKYISWHFVYIFINILLCKNIVEKRINVSTFHERWIDSWQWLSCQWCGLHTDRVVLYLQRGVHPIQQSLPAHAMVTCHACVASN